MSYESRTVTQSAELLVGAPASPLPEEQVCQIRGLMDAMPQVLEAHMPQCYAAGVFDPPAQVLVLVLTPEADPEAVVRDVSAVLGTIVPAGKYLDIWPMRAGDPTLPKIRGVNCTVKAARSQPRKPWWKVW